MVGTARCHAIVETTEIPRLRVLINRSTRTEESEMLLAAVPEWRGGSYVPTSPCSAAHAAILEREA